MQEGSLEDVDNYGWYSARTLRWRSRSPSDAHFNRTEIVYEPRALPPRGRAEGG